MHRSLCRRFPFQPSHQPLPPLALSNSDLYTFFNRATQLDRISSEYHRVVEDRDTMKNELIKKERVSFPTRCRARETDFCGSILRSPLVAHGFFALLCRPLDNPCAQVATRQCQEGL